MNFPRHQHLYSVLYANLDSSAGVASAASASTSSSAVGGRWPRRALQEGSSGDSGAGFASPTWSCDGSETGPVLTQSCKDCWLDGGALQLGRGL